MAQGRGSNAMVVSLIPTRGNELLCINIFISWLWQQSKSPALSAATQHQRLENFGKWGTECLSTRFALRECWVHTQYRTQREVDLIFFFHSFISLIVVITVRIWYKKIELLIILLDQLYMILN